MLRARDNPFATDQVLRQRYRLDEAGWTALQTRLAALRFRAAIVGPHGAGKTTLQEDLAVRLRAEGWRIVWLRLSTECPRLPPACDAAFFGRLGAQDFVMLDGAEQLGTLAWWSFRYRSRKAGGLIVTTHRPGRLRTLWRCETTPELLRDLSAALRVPLSAHEAGRLHARHRGNLREVFRELYDECARGRQHEDQPPGTR
jgi:hypothetical protein